MLYWAYVAWVTLSTGEARARRPHSPKLRRSNALDRLRQLGLVGPSVACIACATES